MKYSKEATTKDGRRTWRVTYELVRGPEPRGGRPSASRAKEKPRKTASASKGAGKAAKRARAARKRRTTNQKQLGLF